MDRSKGVMLHYFFLIGNIGKKNAGLDDQKTVEK